MFLIKSAANFKKENLALWRANSAFWLESKMRHLEHISPALAGLLLRFMQTRGRGRKHCHIADIGCGEAWLLRLLFSIKKPFQYTGFDFNPSFIDHLRTTWSSNPNVQFLRHDVSKPYPRRFAGQFDLAVNCFNFFEVPDAQDAYRNAARLLRTGGNLLVVTIDPVMQILAVSKTRKTFLRNLKLYERFKHQLGYNKRIDVSGERTSRIYRGILYSSAQFVQMARRAGLSIVDYNEVVKTGSPTPQIYDFLLFSK